jgi:hypothetical protein
VSCNSFTFALSVVNYCRKREGGTDFDAELVEFGLDVLGDVFFELLTALEKFFHRHFCDEDTVVRNEVGRGREDTEFHLQ